jgi:hypothetical protein
MAIFAEKEFLIIWMLADREIEHRAQDFRCWPAIAIQILEFLVRN